MKVKDLQNHPAFNCLSAKGVMDSEIKDVCVCDLLSHVMAHAKKDGVWVTIHTHMNMVAVATQLKVACVIIADGGKVEEDVRKRANMAGISLFTTTRSAFEVCLILRH